MLTGSVPLARFQSAPLPSARNPAVPAALDTAVAAALSQEPAQRPTASQLLQLLSSIHHALPGAAA